MSTADKAVESTKWAATTRGTKSALVLNTIWLYKHQVMSPRADRLSTTFAALADPTRRAILARLARGDANVMELSRPFRMTQPAVSKHLKVLERAGLVSRGRAAQARPCRLDASRLKEATDWIAQYRAFWEGSFDRLDAFLGDLKKKGRPQSDGES